MLLTKISQVLPTIITEGDEEQKRTDPFFRTQFTQQPRLLAQAKIKDWLWMTVNIEVLALLCFFFLNAMCNTMFPL